MSKLGFGHTPVAILVEFRELRRVPDRERQRRF